ncbi:nucleotidyltransferase domain-containing protein [Archaeoglobus sp.]
MVTLTDFQIETVKRFKELRKNYAENVKRIKDLAKEVFGENLLSVYVFGSVVEGSEHPMSDVDVAVVLSKKADEEERMELYRSVRETFGLHPFEIHVITSEEWEKWYKRFVRKFVEI